MVLRCTKKLIAILGASFIADPGPLPNDEDWYANLFWFDRRKCLLLTHTATLFTIFEADVTAAQLRSGSSFVSPLIARELVAEDLPTAAFGDTALEKIVWARTANRSVLGCMNDMAFLCETIVARSGSLSVTDHAELNRLLHRNINRTRSYKSPIDLVRERVPSA